MPDVTFLGGPCAGQVNALADDEVASGRTVCRATTYFLQQVGPDTIYAVLPTSGETVTGGAGPGSVVQGPNILTTSSALEGWANMQRALTGDLPRGLRACGDARRTIRGGR